jgi:hypothetical protein
MDPIIREELELCATPRPACIDDFTHDRRHRWDKILVAIEVAALIGVAGVIWLLYLLGSSNPRLP